VQQIASSDKFNARSGDDFVEGNPEEQRINDEARQSLGNELLRL
jgi:hypothetical protein